MSSTNSSPGFPQLARPAPPRLRATRQQGTEPDPALRSQGREGEQDFAMFANASWFNFFSSLPIYNSACPPCLKFAKGKKISKNTASIIRISNMGIMAVAAAPPHDLFASRGGLFKVAVTPPFFFVYFLCEKTTR
jgi:hypothetical protein